MTKYIYCFIRKDLPLVHHIIQIGHVCHEAGQREKLDEPPNMCLLEVENELALLEAAMTLRKAGIKFELFQEDSFDNEFTAICTLSVETKEEREVFKKYKTYKS